MKRTSALVAAGLLGASLVAVPTGAPPAFARASVTLTIVSQANGFNVAPDGAFTIVVQAPESLGLDALTDADIIVTAYDPVDDRLALDNALSGDLSRSIDTVDVAIETLIRPAPRQLSITVPTETTRRTSEALQLANPGIYPVVVDIRTGGDVVAEVLTFIHRLPLPDDDVPGDLNVALAVGTVNQVSLDSRGTATISEAGRNELTALADVIDATAIPITVSVPPSMVAALRLDNPELADRLLPLLTDVEVLSGPVLPLDPSAAAAATQEGLYTQWFRDGEDLFASTAGVRAVRTVSFVPEPLSTAGGTLLRALGSRLLVMPTKYYDDLEGGLGVFTDTTQLVEVRLDDSAVLDAALPDRRLADLLTEPATDPVRSAIIAVAQLLATRAQIHDKGGAPARHSVLLAAADLGMLDPINVAAVTQLIATTPGLHPITVDELGSRTDTLLLDGGVIRVSLPPSVDGDIAGRINTVFALSIESASTGSMLAADDPRLAEWQQAIDRIPSSALDNDEVGAIAAVIRAEHIAIRSGVEPPPAFSFVLTGRSSTIRLRIRNNGAAPVTVRLRLASTKLVFPRGDQLAVLAAGSFTEVEIPVEARSNGRFPVSLEIFTPEGDTYITPPIPLTATVNALTGLGNLITGAALLVLLAWWANHLRTNRRRRAGLRSEDAGALDDTGEIENPASGSESDLSGPELFPDAATSTLPP